MFEIIFLLIVVFFPALLFFNFKEAGFNPYCSFIPIYNYWLWVKMIEKPRYWFFLCLIPFLNLFMIFDLIVETSKNYLKRSYLDYIFAVLLPFIYFPYLGKSEKYHFIKTSELPDFKRSTLRSWTTPIIWALTLAGILNIFVFRNYQIPSSSMERSLMVGDHLLVSNLTYGPKIPNTPIAMPLAHSTLPFTKSTKCYLEWIKLPYHRLPGFRDIKRNDIVVFHYPDGDTVIAERQNEDYYRVVRETERYFKEQYGTRYREGMGYKYIWKKYNIITRPVDKRDNYVKRCVAIAGDTLQIIDQQLYINGVKTKNPEMMQSSYLIHTKDNGLSDNKLRQLDISSEDIQIYKKYHILQLTAEMVKTIKQIPNVVDVERLTTPQGVGDPDILPFDVSRKWNVDNFGPLWIPKAGANIPLTKENIQLYGRCIEVYENNKIEFKDGNYYINGQLSDNYTFKMDYYWMQGDNRHNSLDSRYWGFVPEDHIVGTPLFIYFSKDKDRSLFDGAIRFNRIMKFV